MASGSTSDPAQRRRSTIIVVAVLATIAVVYFLVGQALDAMRDDPAPDRSAVAVTLPSSFAGFTTGSGPAADALRAQIEKRATTSPGTFVPKFQIYRDAGGHLLLASAMSARDSSAARHFLHDQRPEYAVDAALSELQAIGSKSLPPAPFSGEFRCATAVAPLDASSSTSSAVCVWVDRDTTATVFDLSPRAALPGLSIDTLAAATRQLRAAAEPRK